MKNVKKIVVIVTLLVAATLINAGILQNSLDSASNLTHNAARTPGRVLGHDKDYNQHRYNTVRSQYNNRVY